MTLGTGPKSSEPRQTSGKHETRATVRTPILLCERRRASRARLRRPPQLPGYRALRRSCAFSIQPPKRSSNYRPFHPTDFKVVFRSQGGLDLTTLQPRCLLTALMQAAALTDPSTLTLRIHPVNNTCTVSAVNEKDALKLVQLQHITYDKHEYAMTAYIAPPDGSVRGVITNAYWKESPQELLADLISRNPPRNYTRRSTNGTHAIDSHYLWTSHRPTKDCLWWRTASVHALYTKGRDVQ
ncbi:hypothetical protein MRX96_013462 [Rhipicephalus microplus]